MNIFKKTINSALMVSTMSLGAFTPNAFAELSASATISNSYLWRGFELGSGTPAVSADLVYSNSGFYGGLWVSSGDTTGGTEYDLFFGYGGSAGDFSYDIQYISYIYPTGQFSQTDGTFGDFAEAILTLGFGPVSFVYKDNVAGETGGYAFTEDYSYYSLSASFDKFGVAVGIHDEGVDVPSVTGDATHVDLSYAATDNLTFTFSTILDSDLGTETVGGVEPEPLFNVSYSIPLK